MKTKGFIGLGVMGFPMAGHISKNYPTSVFNRTQAKADEWVKTFSGNSVSCPEELGRSCEEIFICIGNDNDVRDVITGDGGILNTMRPGSHCVQNSSIACNNIPYVIIISNAYENLLTRSTQLFAKSWVDLVRRFSYALEMIMT